MKLAKLNYGEHWDFDDELNIVKTPHAWLVPPEDRRIIDPCGSLSEYSSSFYGSKLVRKSYDKSAT